MTKRLVSLCGALLASAALAQPGPTSVPNKPSGAEAEVRGALDAFEAAWNKHDAAGMAAVLAENGDYTEPDGRTVHGRKQVQEHLGTEHGSVFKKTTLHIAIERVKFVRDDVALVDGSYELFGAVNPAGKEVGTRTGYVIGVVSKNDGRWAVNGARLMLPVQLLWRDYGK